MVSNFYGILGKYYTNISEGDIDDKINTSLFNTQSINMATASSSGSQWVIKKLSFEGGDKTIENSITTLNDLIKTNESSVFDILKELITSLSSYGYNFYRGQGHDWPTRPSIFRPLTSIDGTDGNNFYQDFEKLYQQVALEYPDYVKYIELSEELSRIDERADELATLQHYGLPTSLLDVTENPFIALLFMLESDDFLNPQLEFYKFKQDENSHSSNNLLSITHKKNNNKRIKAQKGAFINYDKICCYLDDKDENNGSKELKLKKEYKKIERIIVKIKTEEDANSKSKSDFKSLRKFLIDKLNEFHYFHKDLYPDFNDYLIYLRKKYTISSSNSSINLPKE